jgi:outer membrane protein assembly factor BamB
MLDLLGTKYLTVAVEGKLAGLDPTNGKTLWEHPWKIFMINAQIVQPLELSEDVFLLSAGYGKGAEAIRLKKTANGFETEQIWKSKNLKTKFSNPVLKNGYLYGLSESSLTCLDASTGELQWRGKKYGYGRILLANDKLLILGNTGTLSIVEAKPDSFNEIASRQVLSKERCWNGPALVGGYLVVRNGSEIACYDFAKR